MSENEKDDQQGGGQVSEVSAMDPGDADTPIEPEDATAGKPDSESGEVQEGEAGPNAIPEANEHDSKV